MQAVMNTRHLIPMLVLLFAAWPLAAQQVPAPLPLAKPAARAPAAAKPAASTDQREIRAQLAPKRYTTLAAEVGAKIARIPVQEGAAFKAGQTLVTFDCSLQSAQLNRARAAQSAADKAYSSNRRLAELNSVGKLELDTSEAEVRKAKADVAAGMAVLGKCSIAAPFSGRVAEQKLREQQFAQAGQAVLDIIDDSVLELAFLVPSRWLAWMKPGTTFQVKIDETGKTYPARIERLGARVDPVSQSIKVNAVIDGKFAELMAGMSGKVLMVPPAN
jgi:RND family efflux transporter MFP subunit